MSNSILYLQVEPAFITDINRIFEGYEHLALVSTIDRVAGIVQLRATPDTLPEVLKIVEHLPVTAKILTDFHEV